STRIVVLMTGCEESGLLGAQAFLAGRDTAGWLFVNFDSLGGPATLRFLRREGVLAKWNADRRLVDIAERLRARRPELGLEPTDRPAGLTYDSSPVLARGGRAITFSAQDETIPNLHLPSDTLDNVDPDVLSRALEAGREMIAAIDRGEGD
ncbi:MAG TPA: M28 family peptidase, partial [Solirubrobacterales bacterium]|nr:M28 family peptidase [Solirubrobacterales bacterium]